MDNEVYYIAVASSDGIVVNNHFGRAKTFYIFEVNEQDEFKCVEKREVEPVCNRRNHDDDRLRENLLKLKDCKYLLVSKIGFEAAHVAESLGIGSYEIPGVITDSINHLINYIKIEKLFA